jgi:antibiotic biosynthesis monooxygenase (ABM) superfamily enzyme
MPPAPNNYSTDIQAQISSLQFAQQNLQNMLTNNAATLTPVQQQSITEQINQYQKAISSLTGTVGNLNQVYATNLQNNTMTLNTQTNALSIINNETIDSNNQIAYINDQKINKMRQVQINNYYAAWYQEQIKLLKYLVIYVVIFSIVFYLKKKNIFPQEFFGIFIVLITLVLLFFVIPVVLSILRRDRMNYSKYDWGFDITKAPKIEEAKDKKNDLIPTQDESTASGPECIGAACCPSGSVYDKVNNKCTIGDTYSGTSDYNFSNTFQGVGDQFSSFLKESTSYGYSR